MGAELLFLSLERGLFLPDCRHIGVAELRSLHCHCHGYSVFLSLVLSVWPLSGAVDSFQKIKRCVVISFIQYIY